MNSTTSGDFATTTETTTAANSTDSSTTVTAIADTTALTTDTTTTELTTSSAEFTLSSETTEAATTTTTSNKAAASCSSGFPADHSCNVFRQYTGPGTFIKDIDGSYTLDECVQFCVDDPTCNIFAYGSTFCELWSGTTFVFTGQQTSGFSWYELDFFCVEKAPEP
ncbi:hypothetical protein FBEOM_8357 [Fusarium beomiforme]|uniref:Apple domain-containing protein n=1 Tax=Fusarium beomiforme TaxID=44412 RepID=A0A9P5AFD1_9HYPO|nr:hypothetical protein FBEOM_8357 [Fusarium beomiforme]